PAEALALGEALDELFGRAAAAVARAWDAHSRELIRDHEFIAESLDSASAAADRRALQLQALNVISQQLSAILEPDQLFDLVVTNLSRLTGVAHIALWMPSELGIGLDEGDSGTPALAVCRSSGVEASPLAGMIIPLEYESDIVARAFNSGLLQFEPQPDAPRQGPWLQPGCGVLALPMVSGDRSLAVVVLQDPDPINQLRLQQDLAQAVISQTAIALSNAGLYAEVRGLNVELERRVVERTRELQDEKDRLATIHQISTEVSSTLDLDALLNTSLQLLAGITRAEHASIMLVEQDDSSLMVTRAVLGVPANPNNYIRFPIGSGIAGWVAQHRVGLLIDDVGKDERWVSMPGGSIRKREGAMVTVPLVMQGDVLGVISLSHRQVGYFHEGHLRMLSACAGSIAIGINNANLFQVISAEAERRYELLDHQQKEASQTQAILQSLSDGVIVCDLEGRVLVTNPAAATILARNVEELLLWNLHDILARYLGSRSPEMPLEDLLHRPLTRDEQPRFFQSTLKVGVRTVSLSLGPVLKDDSELLGALLVLHDITREVEADRLKTEFIGTMSHELRTPMTAIKGFTQLLSMGGLGPLNETQREFVTTIYSNTERMIALINDVLDITKIESGSVDLEWRSLHLAETLSGVVTELRGLKAERHHELSISIPPGLPLVRADAHRLHQILLNLLANAFKYTPKGGEISVEAHETSFEQLPEEVRDTVIPGRRYTQLSIHDTGVGIAVEDLSRIFDRFYRTENPLKIEAGGTGLGLSLVKPLVELLGGRIWVRSTPGEGSTFSFILPATETGK
ncbi:MAG: GAF domain-containing protein, partial [Chloroflexales bacterium]|nr:GAF domain-containing protein [Chloroflexales bacterium]